MSTNQEMLKVFAIIYCLILWIPFAIFTSYLAKEKGYNSIIWFVIGLTFPIQIFPLIYVAYLPDKKLRKYIRIISENIDGK
tara:strand:- start:314 stop:556 length:243 start_codon:yes stop_codon:yes gene_type:complete